MVVIIYIRRIEKLFTLKIMLYLKYLTYKQKSDRFSVVIVGLPLREKIIVNKVSQEQPF
jgi:hypothetical protein